MEILLRFIHVYSKHNNFLLIFLGLNLNNIIQTVPKR